MKFFEINRNSWHYRINKFLNESGYSNTAMIKYWEPNLTICSYWFQTISRLLIFIFSGGFLTMILASICVGIYNNPIDFLILFATVFGLILLPILVLFIFDLIKKYIKPKHCTPIKFKSENEE